MDIAVLFRTGTGVYPHTFTGVQNMYFKDDGITINTDSERYVVPANTAFWSGAKKEAADAANIERPRP